MSDKSYILSIDALTRAVKVEKTVPHAFFLGAGASITSGVKSAYECIWDWKREIYLSHNPEVKHLMGDLASDKVKNMIQSWLDNRGGFPVKDSDEEYSFYIEKTFPISDSRRQYFQNIVEHKTPYLGYNLLSLLAEENIVKAIWTTNFDGLITKAAANFKITPIDIGLDNTDRINRPLKANETLVVALHGDYRYDALKNTQEELQTQEDDLIGHFKTFLKNNHLIINGYSGRDKSIMEALKEAYSKDGSGRLYWCGYGNELSPEVENLIKYIRSQSREAFYVPTEGFDDLISKLSRHCLESDKLERAIELISDKKSENNFTPFNLQIDHVNQVIKSNLFPVELPKEVFQFESNEIKGEGVWKKLRIKIENEKVAAVPFRGNIYAISDIKVINAVFKGTLVGDIQRTPVSDSDLKREDSHFINLFKTALVKGIAEKFSLETNGKSKLWETIAYESKSVSSQSYPIHRACILSIKKISRSFYLAITPSIHIVSDQEVPDNVDKEIKRLILDKQWNKVFNEDVGYWRDKFFGKEKSVSVGYPNDSSENIYFRLKSTPLFTKVMDASKTYGQTLQGNQSFYKQEGINFKEPSVVFSSADGSKRVVDTHPIRGILNNQPYDYSLTQKTLNKEITLGIICPEKYNEGLKTFLEKQNSQIKATTNKDYLFDFIGFESTYGIKLSIPNTNEAFWGTNAFDPSIFTNVKEGSLALAKEITAQVDKFLLGNPPNILVILIPAAWNNFCGYSIDNEKFDLHDYIKAYAAQRSIATQLIREKTLKDFSLSCQIHWWLSLSFYAKSLRTPWILDNVDENTAFAGIGYSIDPTKKEAKVLLGCSHIFNSKGEGLKYKLSKVENPVFIQRNPHLSREDAIKFGCTIRQLFWESMGKMPERVVIHKRTFFTRDEKQGIIEGLGNIENVDLIEINFERDIKYVASQIKNGKPNIDGFPLNRGTCVQVDGSSILLWTHGAVAHAHNEYYKYYKGGRRIPAPLRIKKHHGNSDVGTIANEILGLTKMNWNTFDMYAQLPTTIQSSSEIARIGSLLERYDKTFDYRLFI